MDIQSRADIELLLNTFYEKVRKEDTIGFIFNDIAKVNWEHHIPIICDFWETLLLGASSYTKNAMQVHYSLNRIVTLEEKHFQRWLQLFSETVDDLFGGNMAMQAKTKARSIASLMQFKMNQENKGLNLTENR
ncbi:MAG TPA: group III truncated hemoglobin [Chitinophagaceae bacterium]|nr:group III truncated hemoglobin [Chitinophagaceae bacterium]